MLGDVITANFQSSYSKVLGKDEVKPIIFTIFLFRPVFKRGEKCLVHFLMLPDSQDNWGICYPEADTPDVPEVGRQSWFGCYKQDPQNFFPIHANGKSG